MYDATDYVRRAMAAYFRSGGNDQPANSSCMERFEDRNYVVLKNIRGVLAVYRVRPDGVLKRLKRWPGELE